MKKLFLLLALLGMVAVGCSKDDTDKGNDNKTEQPNENEGGNEDSIPENIFFGLDKESVTISPDGGSVDVIVYSNYKWEISGTSDWCTPSAKSGDANEDGQKVTFSADVAYDDREATFWFRCADKQIKFVVSQKLKETIIHDANNTFNITAEGGIAVISYQTSVDCDIIIPEEAQDWITIAPASRGLVSENINLDIAENTTYSSRSAVIKVVAKDNAALVVEYTINQVQNDAILADENNVFTVSCAGGEVVIQYQTNVDCEIIVPTNAQSWITILPETRSLVAQSTTLHIAENMTYSARSAVIKVVAKDNAALVVEYTINQVQNDAILADENNTFTVPSAGGEVVINYQTNIDCDVIIPEEAQSWITIEPTTRGLVSESITLNIAENTTYSARTAVIKVVAKDNAELVVEYTINQEQNDAVLANGNTEFTISGREQQITIEHKANVDCEVIIPDDAQDWITIAPATRGLVSESITLNIAENTTYSARTAVIKVVAKDNAELVVEYTINQEQNDAILADENNTFTVPCAGGEVAINYQTNIDCEVIIPKYAQSWITIAPATRGLVSESITLNVAENTSYSTRTAVVKVVAKDNTELAIEYTINQEPNDADAILADGNTEFTIDGRKQQITIKYKANVDCDVIIPDDAQDWITIEPATRGLSTYSTTLNIAENNSDKERSCVIKVTSQGDNELFAEYTITQNPRYSLYYTSSNGEIVQPYDSSAFGATILSNTYIDGVGVIEFKAPITKIGDEAFRGCSNLTSVTIPDSVTTIGDVAFAWCSSLTSVTIPDSVTSIGDVAFRNCDSLTSVTIGDSVTTIGKMAFAYCSSLKNVTFGDSITEIGEMAFDGCSSLIRVYIANIAAWCQIRFIGSYSNPLHVAGALFLNDKKVTNLIIPDSVTQINSETFKNCFTITTVTIGDSVTTIGDSAFRNCDCLTSVTIGDSVTTIGNRAFMDCDILTSVTIGESVTSIGDYAFAYCGSLTSLYCKATTPPKCGSQILYATANTHIMVPLESLGAYNSANYWSDRVHLYGYNF